MTLQRSIIAALLSNRPQLPIGGAIRMKPSPSRLNYLKNRNARSLDQKRRKNEHLQVPIGPPDTQTGPEIHRGRCGANRWNHEWTIRIRPDQLRQIGLRIAQYEGLVYGQALIR
jgi:hypothetical protein